MASKGTSEYEEEEDAPAAGSDAEASAAADAARWHDPTDPTDLLEPRANRDADSEDDPMTAVRAELETAKHEAAAHRDQYVRTLAELQNVQRRHERDRADLAKYAAESVLRDLLPTLDDLERAIAHAGVSGAALGEGLVGGVEMILKGLTAVIERHGVRRIVALGQPFDPSKHEAVGTADEPGAAPNTVIAEHRAGYTIGDRLLRPAMVVVAMAKSPASDA